MSLGSERLHVCAWVVADVSREVVKPRPRQPEQEPSPTSPDAIKQFHRDLKLKVRKEYFAAKFDGDPSNDPGDAARVRSAGRLGQTSNPRLSTEFGPEWHPKASTGFRSVVYRALSEEKVLTAPWSVTSVEVAEGSPLGLE